MAKYFPLFVDFKDKPVLIVGAGPIATGKAEQLLKYGASLTIVAPDISDSVRQWSEEGKVTLHQREFHEADIDGHWFVVASTNVPAVNQAVFDAASEARVLANIVDVPELCHFAYGAIVERGDLQIAISTSGRSPAFAGYLRRQLELQFGEEYSLYLDILAECRVLGRQYFPGDFERQKAVYETIMQMDLITMIQNSQTEDARNLALDAMRKYSPPESETDG